MVTVEGKVIAVTGTCGALGSALVEELVAGGATAVIAGDLDGARLEETRARFASSATDVHPVPVDVRDMDGVEGLVGQAVARHGRLDVMINTAGVLSPSGRLHNLGPDDWRLAIEVNLLGTVNGTTAAVRAMRQSGGGSIVNTGSAAGLTGWAYTGPYGVTKAAVIQLTRIAAIEYARDRIRVNCVCPGTFPSAIHEGLDEAAMAAISERHPLGLGTARDVVGAFVYLASDDAAWTTGQALIVDGGYTAQ